MKRSRSTTCSRAGGGGVLQAKRSRSTACSGVGGGGVLQAERSRSRAKRSSSDEWRKFAKCGAGRTHLIFILGAKCATRVH
jgi:hypothetical protein